MQIEVESPMRSVEDAYQPTFRGEPLEVEASLPEVSLRNLRVLLKAGLKVVSMLIVENGNILVVFQTGETYLATGFACGEASDLTKFFGQFLSEAFKLKRRDCEDFVVHGYTPTSRGIINMRNMPSTGPKIHQPE